VVLACNGGTVCLLSIAGLVSPAQKSAEILLGTLRTLVTSVDGGAHQTKHDDMIAAAGTHCTIRSLTHLRITVFSGIIILHFSNVLKCWFDLLLNPTS
jgi:hypothetical protein